MLGMEVVVIIGWVGLGKEAVCGNGKIPPGSFSLWLLTSYICLVGLGGGNMGRASFVDRRGVWGTFVVLVWRKIQLHQRNGGSTLA